VQELESDADASFAFGPGSELLWRGAGVASLVAGETALAPRVEVLASELLDTPLKERIRKRVAAWLDSHVRDTLACLFALRDSAPAGTARGIAFALAEGLGAVTRRSVARQVSGLGPEDRRELGRLGVNIGRLVVFLPALQHADAMRLRARLHAVRRGARAEPGPGGIPSAPNDESRSAEDYLACGYFPAGPRVIRLDRLERAAALTSRLSRGGPFLPPKELAGILGCRPDELPAILTAIGYREREGRFERTGRPAARASRPRS
jgi:ATP-dependent RNA helicase SUPV3L1/SUV3